MEPRRRLGKGLSGLIGPAPVKVEVSSQSETPASPPVSVDTNNVHTQIHAAQNTTIPTGSGMVEPDAERVLMVAVGEVSPSRYQPRQVFDESKIRDLADSIRSIGMMQPVIVRRRDGNGGTGGGAGGGAKFELVAGERRWRAAQLAGLTTVPAIVRELGDEESAAWGLIENVQREDLDPMEKAWACRVMQERFGLTPTTLAERLGLDRSTVSNLVRLTELEEPIQAWVREGKLSAGHAKALLGLEAGEKRLTTARAASDAGWSVRRLEDEVKKIQSGGAAVGGGTAAAPAGKSASIADLEKRLGEHLGTRVTIRTDRSGKRGKLEIAFFDLDHFDGLMEKMGYK